MTNYLTSGESVTQSLGKLYRKFGYSRYKISKFEEYDTYVKNKDFLISDRVITFTDVNGKLLAMKPDVTISIIKNTDDTPGAVHKLYYKENVYRVSDSSHGFKEIMQMGLECIGDIDSYSVSEVIALAADSLGTISDNYVLDVSHMGFVSGILTEAGFTAEETTLVLNAIGEKNIPCLVSICNDKQLSSDMADRILGLVNIYGPISEVIDRLDSISVNAETDIALSELKAVCSVLKQTNSAGNIRIDFSVVNDMNYYNGLVFRGYIEGIPAGVLSGGQYDKLMTKMGKKSKAIGFAVYLDLLEMLISNKREYDADVLVVYDDSCSPASVYSKAKQYTDLGRSVLVLKNAAADIRCKEIVNMTERGAK